MRCVTDRSVSTHPLGVRSSVAPLRLVCSHRNQARAHTQSGAWRGCHRKQMLLLNAKRLCASVCTGRPSQNQQNTSEETNTPRLTQWLVTLNRTSLLTSLQRASESCARLSLHAARLGNEPNGSRVVRAGCRSRHRDRRSRAVWVVQSLKLLPQSAHCCSRVPASAHCGYLDSPSDSARGNCPDFERR